MIRKLSIFNHIQNFAKDVHDFKCQVFWFGYRSSQCRPVLGGTTCQNCANIGCTGAPAQLNNGRGLSSSHPVPFGFINSGPVTVNGIPAIVTSGASNLPGRPPLIDSTPSGIRLCHNHYRSPQSSSHGNLGTTSVYTGRTTLPYHIRGGHKYLRQRTRHRGMSMGQKVSGM